MRVLLLLPLLCLLTLLSFSAITWAAPTGPFFPPDSGVLLLNDSSFSAHTHRETENTFVAFYSPSAPHPHTLRAHTPLHVEGCEPHPLPPPPLCVSACSKSGKCKDLQPEWVKLARAVNGMVTIAAVDCLQEEKLCEFEEATDSLPVLKLYAGTGIPRRYGGPPTAKGFSSFAFFSLPHLVTTVNAATIDSRRSASLNRVLLFTDKADTPNLYKALAQRLKGQLEFAEVKQASKGERKLMDRYGVTQTPTIAIEHGGGTTVYDGAMTFPALLAHLQAYAKVGDADGGIILPELVDQSCLDVYCVSGKASLCAVMVVSGSSPSLSSSLTLFRGIADVRADPVYQHLWLDSDKHADFLLSAFGLYPADYPQVVVLSAKKDRYVSYMGTMSTEDVGDWLRMITVGKVRTVPYETKDGKLPPLSDGNDSPACTPPPPPPPSPAARGPLDKYLHQLTSANFEAAVLDRKAAWMVLVTTESMLNAQMPTWLALVNRTRNAVRVGVINADREPQLLLRINVTAAPAVRWLKAGGNRTEWGEYAGEFNETALTDFSQSLLHAQFVQRVRGEEGLVKFMSGGNPDAPRILLFSKHAQVPPLLSSLSIDFHPHLIFGLASATDPVLTKKFSIKKIPSMVALGQLDKGDAGGQIEMVAGSYEGALAWDELRNWMEEVRRDGVVNEGMPNDVKARYKAARRKEEEKRLKAEEEQRAKRKKEEKEAERRQAEAKEASCEVTADDSEGQCTAPPSSSTTTAS